MRVSTGSFLMLAVLCCAIVCGEAAEQKCSVIGVVTIGDVDSALRDRVLAYIRKQYEVAPVLRKRIRKAPATMQAVKTLLAGKVRPGDACLLALAAVPVDDEKMIDREARCAVVNVSALEPGKAAERDRTEVLGRRVEKESLRAIALTVGVPACKFPRCALYKHADDPELDFKSRNPCPPCQERVRRKFREIGVLPTDDQPAKVE